MTHILPRRPIQVPQAPLPRAQRLEDHPQITGESSSPPGTVMPPLGKRRLRWVVREHQQLKPPGRAVDQRLAVHNQGRVVARGALDADADAERPSPSLRIWA